MLFTKPAGPCACAAAMPAAPATVAGRDGSSKRLSGHPKGRAANNLASQWSEPRPALQFANPRVYSYPPASTALEFAPNDPSEFTNPRVSGRKRSVWLWAVARRRMPPPMGSSGRSRAVTVT